MPLRLRDKEGNMELRDYQWENKNKIATVRFKCPFCGELVMTN